LHASAERKRILSRRSRAARLRPDKSGLRRGEDGHDLRNFEPRKWLKFEDIDKSIQELRAIYKVHPEWFETPKPKSDKGQNAVDYSIKI